MRQNSSAEGQSSQTGGLMVFIWISKAFLNRKRTLPCIAIVTLIVTAIVAALIFSESMMSAVSEKLTGLYSGTFRVYSSEKPASADGISLITHGAMGYGILYGKENTRSVAIKGVEDLYFNDRRLSMLDIVSAETDSSSKIPRILIGSETAGALNLKPGDKAAIMLMGSNGKTQPVLVYVSSVYSSGVNDIDSLIVYAPFEWASTRFEDIFWEIELSEGADEDAVRFALISGGIDSAAVKTWKDINYDIYLNFENSRANISAVLGLCLILGAVYVIFIANETVRDDRQRLATLMMLGSSKRKILGLSLISVISIVSAGILIGLIIGFAAGINLSPLLTLLKSMGVHAFDYYTIGFKPLIPYRQIAKAVALLLLLSVFSAYLSLRRVLHISPMEMFVR